MRAFFRAVLAQSVLTNLLFIICIVVGLFALFSLPVERYPNVQMGKVMITTVYPGASPQDIESLVTTKIEDALDDLAYVEFVQSTSYRDRSVVVVKFIDDTDYDELFVELRLKVLGQMNELPRGIDPPSFTMIDVNEWLPVVTVNLVGERSNRALALMADEMKLQLRRIPGVKEVEVQGEYTRELHVELSQSLMAAYGVTIDDVTRALEGANISVPAGNFENSSGEFMVLVDEKFRSRSDVARAVIRRDGDGSFLTVGQVVTDIRPDYREPAVISSVNGRDAVQINLKKTPEGSALAIMPEVLKVVEHFRPALEKDGVEVLLSRDQRDQIGESISTLGSNLLVGIVLVFGVIYLFMGLRNATLTVVGIPFSFLLTMVFMWVGGWSLNEITLFSFVLVSGIIVDDAIVVIENIYRHLQEGKPIREAIVLGASEVSLPVVAATATTVAAFLPMLMMTGSTGEFFAQIPVAISAALIASLFECLITLPPHFLDWPGRSRAVHAARHEHTAQNERRIMRIMRAGAARVVGFTMRHRFKSLAIVGGTFLLALFILGVSVSGVMPLMRIKFFPDEYFNYFVDVQGPATASTQQRSERLKAISVKLLEGGPGQIRTATATAGMMMNEDYEAEFGSNMGNVIVELPLGEDQRFPENPDNSPVAHLEYIRRYLAPFAEDGWVIRVRPEPGGPPTGKSINVRVVGPNPASVAALAEEMKRFLRSREDIFPHLLDFGDNLGRPARVVRFRPDPERCAEYGLTPAQVATFAATILDGRFVGEYRTADDDVDIRLKISSRFLDRPEQALEQIVVQHPAGPVRLGDVAALETYTEPYKLGRYQDNRAVAISANLREGAPTSVPAIIRAVREHYAGIKFDYPGAELSYAGEFETTQRSYTSLLSAFLVALLIIYLILATQFQSYTQPALIMTTIVFSLTGVILGKFVTQGIFTVNSFIATIGVSGVAVNDAIVLIDFLNRLHGEGLSRREAILEAIRVRLRPILLTTLTTVLGLLPMAVGFPTYSLVWGSMASTFVTGLCTATLLTLFIVPILWDMLHGFHDWIARRFPRAPIAEE